MEKKLIIDVGMHLGQDTKFYLSNGYRVVAVEASPLMVGKASKAFSSFIENGDLIVINYAVASVAGQKLKFHLSEVNEWSSLKTEIASRLGREFASTEVESNTLSALFNEYGVPYYCKIDIEGFDEDAIRSCQGVKEIPKFMSCETECLGENEVFTDEEALGTLNALRDIGYKKFKLVDQETLEVLDRKSFYLKDRSPSILFKAIRKLFHFGEIKVVRYTNHELLSQKFDFHFTYGASGPFGDMLNGEWLSYKDARDMLLFHREEFFRQEVGYKLYTLWCDWHATY